MKYAIGERVEKVGGDYRYVGRVVSAFTKLSGQERYVVENADGVLFIFNEKGLRREVDSRRCPNCGSLKAIWASATSFHCGDCGYKESISEEGAS